ncbi:hypothetical protein K5D34_25510 [Pseudomonas cichorii]|nr:hypothetical protein [Pseudomonas cichorii]MBX8493270.1 hypothetical protein [Pseudomonas cichorii]MBX8513051.1 hypothetical protein [Pseudomonas cichorii]MBX8523034.1 hypothetical protein [Pseudomonas cichorii]MBX8528016.1 hypothetical protein [Pseudomonas cichorii]MBX8538030.1 hypothetical protein [Pseudomonas cichorii]
MACYIIRSVSTISVVVTLTLFTGLPYSVAQGADADGQLVILNKKNPDDTYPNNCSIPFVTSTINFQDNSLGCVNDDAYAFRLENVPSATFFSFYDSPACTESGNFSYRFKTIKQPTDMELGLDIEEAGKKQVGSVVVPGVMLISSSTSGQVGGKLSCVKIERSAVPAP